MINGNRTKSNRPRSPRDLYITPESLAVFACNKLYWDEDYLQDISPTVLDAGCGNGVWGRAVSKFALITDEDNIYPYLVGIDLEPSIDKFRINLYDKVITGDYLDYTTHIKFDIVLGNPPYSLAEKFIRHSYSLLDENGYIYFLLRLSFLEGIKRVKGFYKEFPLKKVYVCSRRPSFFSSKGEKHTTDTLSYGMFLWQKGYEGKPEIDWLDWNY